MTESSGHYYHSKVAILFRFTHQYFLGLVMAWIHNKHYPTPPTLEIEKRLIDLVNEINDGRLFSVNGDYNT
jgi:hypothetical protein